MKTKIFSKLMPLFVFVLGIAGAFATMSMGSADSTLVARDGWAKDLDETPCMLRVDCQTTGQNVCKHANGFQAYEKSGPTTCPITLFKIGG